MIDIGEPVKNSCCIIAIWEGGKAAIALGFHHLTDSTNSTP
ncbi:MAG: hypothetical protein P5700_22470 [Arthrospira platensis PCC 7345]|nr:hypothetical protein [Arthrospira platensis PCC 7345]